MIFALAIFDAVKNFWKTSNFVFWEMLRRYNEQDLVFSVKLQLTVLGMGGGPFQHPLNENN